MGLVKQSSIYTLTSFLVSGIPFLLLPLLTNYLSPRDYGIISIFNTSVRLVMPFIGIGIITSIGIEFFKLSKDEFRSYFSSVLIIPIVSFFAVMLVVILSGKYFIGYFDIENVKWLYVLPFLALFSISEELALTLLRNKKEAVPYGVAKTLKVIIEISLTLYLIIELGMKWEGRMLSWGLAALLAGIAPLIYFKKIKI